MKVQILVDHLEHDGKRIEQGAVIDIPPAQADALMAIGAAQPAAEPERKAGKKGD